MKFSFFPILLILSVQSLLAQTPSTGLPTFMGRPVTISEPEHDEMGFPQGIATVCVELDPQRQCYNPPKGFGNRPTVSVLPLDETTEALLYSVETGGVSGWSVLYVLLVPGRDKELHEFSPTIQVSNQNQRVFWTDPAVSSFPIFLVADYVWGTMEGHYGSHRYVISAYVRDEDETTDSERYELADQFMTAGKYDIEQGADVLLSEKQEILLRLGKVKSASASAAR